MRRRMLIGAVSLMLLSLLFLGGAEVLAAVRSVPIFRVQTLQLRWPAGAQNLPKRFRIVPPTAIFDIHLDAVRALLEARFPMAEVIQVDRILPNHVVASMQHRALIAQIPSDGRFHPVSDDGMIVSEGRPAHWPDLPVLFLEEEGPNFRAGQRLATPGFWAASELLGAINRQGGIRGHRVLTVKVQKGVLMVFLNSGLEIRFDQNDLASEWRKLWELVAQRWETLKRARYVDLRFDDPVIGVHS